MSANYETEVVIAGGGLAAIATAHELLTQGRRVLMIEKGPRDTWGGLAKESFGGVHMIGTPHQRRMKIDDSPELAFRDWLACAQFADDDNWPRQWAQFYCENSIEYIFEYLDGNGVEFLPIVNWPERGLTTTYNTVPRWHIALGTGHEIIVRALAGLEQHPGRDRFQVLFEHEVSGFEMTDGRASGVHGRRMDNGEPFHVRAEHVVIASGGICGGDLSKVRANWYADWGDPPEHLLNGSHIYADGMLHDRAAEAGARLTHLDKQWHYAAGVHHPARRKPNDGLSLVPPRSALWVNALGQRIRTPWPLIPYSDTRHLVASIVRQPGKYSWQVMNWKIAIKELAVSGGAYMTAFRDKKKVRIVMDALFGNRALIRRLIEECPDDIVVADNLEDLVAGMNERNLYGLQTDYETLAGEIDYFDRMIRRGPKYHNDEQLRWIANFRKYPGDRLRTCNFQPINDPKARPLIAIREFILTRKSLGGIQTDLGGRVLNTAGEAIPGLYAVGESAGFGGGGIHGIGALEGTFLGGCVLTGRATAHFIAKDA